MQFARYVHAESRTVLIGGMRLGGAAIRATVPANYCFNSFRDNHWAHMHSRYDLELHILL